MANLRLGPTAAHFSHQRIKIFVGDDNNAIEVLQKQVENLAPDVCKYCNKETLRRSFLNTQLYTIATRKAELPRFNPITSNQTALSNVYLGTLWLPCVEPSPAYLLAGLRLSRIYNLQYPSLLLFSGDDSSGDVSPL